MHYPSIFQIYCRCVERLLHNWDPLKDYFHTHKKKLDEAKLKKKVAEERKNAPQKSKTPMNKNDTLMKNKNPQESQTTAASSSSESTYCTQSYAEKKVEAIDEFVKSPTNKLYMIFLNYTTCI